MPRVEKYETQVTARLALPREGPPYYYSNLGGSDFLLLNNVKIL